MVNQISETIVGVCFSYASIGDSLAPLACRTINVSKFDLLQLGIVVGDAYPAKAMAICHDMFTRMVLAGASDDFRNP